MAMTTYFKNTVLDAIFRRTNLNIGKKVYLGLSKTAPNEDGTNITEPSGGAYKRAAIDTDETSWTVATDGKIQNKNTIRFEESTASWTTSSAPITHWALYDAETGGNVLFYGSLVDPREIPKGSAFEIRPNTLQTTLVNAKEAEAV